MPRQDLLSLTPDDLAALSNRGIVKRAQREIESGEVSPQITEEPDGTIVARWPDGAVCRISPHDKISDRSCTCSATAVCRHLVGAILAYQALQAQSPATAAAAPESWDPGNLTDQSIAQHFPGKVLTALRRQFDAGMVVELHRGARPSARFHTLAHALRFLAPNDPRFTRCDCSDPAPCKHVPLAIWAFRLLPSDCASGLVSTESAPLPPPATLLTDLDSTLEELLEYGIANLPDSFAERLDRLESSCRQSDLVWLAGILSDLIRERRQYLAHDARFSPAHVASLLGELVIRADAARFPGQPVPPMFIRGSSSETTAEMGNSRLIGLGTAVELRRSSVVLAAYLQDAATGVVVALPRAFADDDSPRPFTQLARTVVLKSASLAAVGAGQVVIHGGKRSPNGEFLPGRARAALNPQNYQWEQLRPPVLAASFADLVEQQALRPHPCLRPRRLTEDLHVCPIAAVEKIAFNVREQCVEATLHDAQGQPAALLHPYFSRGQQGAEALLHHLRNSRLLFVAGKARLGAPGLVIAPTALVFDRAGERWMLQPWVSEEVVAATEAQSAARETLGAPLRRHLAELLDLLGECVIVGRDRVAPRLWADLRRQSQQLGLTEIPGLIAPHSALALSALVVYALAGETAAP